jgi:hypothetical protein
MRLDGLEILHASRDDSSSVSSATELKVLFDHFPLPRLVCVPPRPQCRPATLGDVLAVRPRRDIFALMSGIVISM